MRVKGGLRVRAVGGRVLHQLAIAPVPVRPRRANGVVEGVRPAAGRVDGKRSGLRLRQGFQRLAQSKRAGKALGRVRRAGLAHQLPQRILCAGGQGQGLARKPPGPGLLCRREGDGLRVGRVEGHPVGVQQLVHHKAEGIDVHIGGVLLAAEHLRGHVVHGACPGGRAGGSAGDAGHAEIAQLVIAGVRNKNVGGLDIPVDDVVLPAHFQRAAQVGAQADDLGPGEGLVLAQCVVDGPEQLHADEDIPPDAVLMGDDLVVLIAHDVAVAFQAAHEGDLAVQLLHIVAEIGGCALAVHAGFQHLLILAFVRRDGDGLQRAGEHHVEIPALDLEHLAVAARTDETLDVPGAEEGLVALIVFVVHDSFSSLCRDFFCLQSLLASYYDCYCSAIRQPAGRHANLRATSAYNIVVRGRGVVSFFPSLCVRYRNASRCRNIAKTSPRSTRRPHILLVQLISGFLINFTIVILLVILHHFLRECCQCRTFRQRIQTIVRASFIDDTYNIAFGRKRFRRSRCRSCAARRGCRTGCNRSCAAGHRGCTGCCRSPAAGRHTATS